jgi:hypothetical protein
VHGTQPGAAASPQPWPCRTHARSRRRPATCQTPTRSGSPPRTRHAPGNKPLGLSRQQIYVHLWERRALRARCGRAGRSCPAVGSTVGRWQYSWPLAVQVSQVRASPSPACRHDSTSFPQNPSRLGQHVVLRQLALAGGLGRRLLLLAAHLRLGALAAVAHLAGVMKSTAGTGKPAMYDTHAVSCGTALADYSRGSAPHTWTSGVGCTQCSADV